MIFTNFYVFIESLSNIFTFIRMLVQHPKIVELKKVYVGDFPNFDGTKQYVLCT